METQHHSNKKDHKEVVQVEEKSKQESHISPPSASSSPSHEFSFTISVHPSSVAAALPGRMKPATATATTTTAPPSFAIDLSPADDIFFHGHLLPLHLLSHLPISPRSSTNSLDSFSLPIKDLLEDGKPNNNKTKNTQNNTSNNNGSDMNDKSNVRRSSKYKSFPLFGFARWRKGYVVGEKEKEEDQDDQMKMNKKKKSKVRINVTHILRRYIRMVRPLLVFRGRRENRPLRRQTYSFSGNLSWKGNKQEHQEWRSGRREHSAPASMWTSPTNSGLLVATTSTTLHSCKSDSTMEELQNAIQAAIAHCKNSIAVKEEKLIKC